MVETIYNQWQKKLTNLPSAQSIPLYQKRHLFVKMLDALFSGEEDVHYLLPELIDIVERNNLNYQHFLNALFILRDEIVSMRDQVPSTGADIQTALHRLQDIIVKVGAYFSYLRTDLNVPHKTVHSMNSDRIETNILHLDQNLNIEKTNSGLLTYFGYQKKEVIGKPLHFLFSASSQNIIRKAESQLNKELRFKIDLEVEAQNREGRRFQALLKISRLNIGQHPAKFSAYVQDNTYIHETKSMLNLLSMALESVGEGIFILEPEFPCRILYVNEALEKMSGFPRHHLLGNPFSVLRNLQQNDGLEEEIFQASLERGWKGEITNRHKNNHHYLVTLHTRPVKDEYGKSVAIVGIERDITRQKSRETEIVHLKKFVEHIINNLPHFVFVTDSHLKIKFWNQSLEDKLGIRSGDVIGKPVLDILPQLKKFNPEMVARNVLQTGKIFIKKFLTDFSGSQESYYQLFITPITTDSQDQLLWTIQDITKEELLKVRITWQNARLKFLENFSQLLNTHLDLKSIFLRFTREFREIFPFKTLSFYLPYHPENLQFNLFFLNRDGENSFPQNHILDLSKENLFRELIQSKRPQVRNLCNSGDDHGISAFYEELCGEAGQMVHFPIIFEKEILGILNVGHEESEYYSQDDLDFLHQIASHLAIALKNSFYFNLIELQNQKLNIINSIFNVPQNVKSIPRIYQNAIFGLCKLLQSQSGAFYESLDGEVWQKVSIPSSNGAFPTQVNFSINRLHDKTHFWDTFHSSIPVSGLFSKKDNCSSGMLSWESSSTLGYLAFLSTNNQILDQISPHFVSSLVQDVLKQMMIALDKINLFEKVQRSEKEWETTFNTVDIGLVVVDNNFTVNRWNSAFQKLYRFSSVQKNSTKCREIFCNNQENPQCCLHQAGKKKMTNLDIEYFDPQIKRTIKRSFFPIFNTQDEFKGGVISIQDVTEYRQQEAKIQFLSKFPEANPNVVVSIDSHGEVQYLNQAAHHLLEDLKLPPGEVKKILPADLKRLVKKFNRHHATQLELEHRLEDRVFQYTVFRPEEDNYLYFYGTDITEKIEMQNQLLQTERIRGVGEMAAGVAHDFNNLLATILGRTQLLELRSDNEQTQNELKIIEKAALDGGQIVRRMQEVTREKRDRSLHPIDVNELIKESIIFTANKLKISTQLKDKKVEIKTDFTDDLIVKGNAVELKEVFTNLLLNAYDAMPNGGDLQVTTGHLKDDNFQIIIKDTGFGMSDEVKAKIFNPFFTTKGDQGTGLGLSIAYKTITAHGGNIKVESEYGKGTTFIITLPLCQELPRQKQDTDDENQTRLDDVKLLIIDDEPELLDTMAEILRLKFKSVEIASDGPLALKKIGKKKYDVVLTDLGMPDMSGWELARRVKGKLPKSHVILVTGWGEQAREELKHHPYVDELLPKPYELKEVISKINNLYHHPKSGNNN